jgi:hypothetical protein
LREQADKANSDYRRLLSEYESLMNERNAIMDERNSIVDRWNAQQARLRAASQAQSVRREPSSGSNIYGPYHVTPGGTVTGPNGSVYQKMPGGMVIDLNNQ